MKNITFDKHKLQIALSSILLILAFGYLFKDVIVNLFNIWLDDGNYSHGFLVPIVVGYFIWLKREKLQETPVRPFWPALLLVILSGLMLIAGQLAIHRFTQHASLFLMMFSLVLLVFGKGWLGVVIVPLVFLAFMFPLPQLLRQSITEPLQLFSSFISVNFLHFLDYPIYREGNILYLADTTLSVAEACSGLRSIVALTFASAVIGYLTFEKKWKTIIPVLCAFPVAIMLNLSRISGTVVLADIWGSETALKFFHDFSGVIVILVAIVIITALIVFLRKIELRESKKDEKESHQTWPIGPLRPAAMILSAILLAGIAVYGDFIFSMKPEPTDIFRLPVKLGPYSGYEQKIDSAVTKYSSVTQDRNILYSNSHHPPINVYLGYYRTSRELSGFIHSPDSCIPGGGWEIVNKKITSLNMNGKDSKVVRYVARMGHSRQILITWVQTGPRIEIDHRQMIMNTFFNALTRFRYEDAVKVMVSTTLKSSETKEEANSRILDFINIFYPKLIKLTT